MSLPLAINHTNSDDDSCPFSFFLRYDNVKIKTLLKKNEKALPFYVVK